MRLQDFQQRVAQRLSIVPTSGFVSAEDAEVIGQAYTALMRELAALELAHWDAEAELPDLYADCLVGMTSAAVVDEFTIPEPRRSQIIGQHAFGSAPISPTERRLRSLARAYIPGVTPLEFF